MGVTSKLVTVASAGIGLAVFSQAPEFAQQYRQRLGGAVEELQAVVGDFDRDAEASAMTRLQALDTMRGAPERFTRDRGESMTRTVARYERLAEQQALMERAHPVTRPLFVLRHPDRQVLKGAWTSFEPAVPLTLPGAVHGGAGALLLALLARLGIGSARRRRKRRNDKRIGVTGGEANAPRDDHGPATPGGVEPEPGQKL